MRSDIIPKSGVVKPRDNASKSRLTLGRFYRINDEREAQKITPKQRSVKSMTPVLLPILCSAVACRVKNNFYLLLTATTLDENGRYARINAVQASWPWSGRGVSPPE